MDTESSRFDVIYPEDAKVLAKITSLDKDYPILTCNKYGKGKAFYIGLPASTCVIDSLFDDLIKELSIKTGPQVPQGVMARYIDDKHILYLNTGNDNKQIVIHGNARSLLSGKHYDNIMSLGAFEPEFIEFE